jgi:hypothetical protein
MNELRGGKKSQERMKGEDKIMILLFVSIKTINSKINWVFGNYAKSYYAESNCGHPCL